jgi:hypothetical protein
MSNDEKLMYQQKKKKADIKHLKMMIELYQSAMNREHDHSP